MLLAADVGNTNVVFALFDRHADGSHTTRARWRIATDPRRTGDEYAVWLLQLLKIEGFERDQIKQIIVASVVPRADHNLTVLCEKYFGITPLFAGQGPARWRFEIDVDQRIDRPARGRVGLSHAPQRDIGICNLGRLSEHGLNRSARWYSSPRTSNPR